MLVFIDESGDPGFKLKRGSTPIFVAALVAFRDHDQARGAQAAIDTAAVRLNIRPEFKFNKCRDEIRDAFFEAVRPFKFCVRAIAVQRDRIYSPHLRTQKEAFYSFFVKSMLTFDDGLLRDARIVIDGSGERGFRGDWRPICAAISAAARSRKSGSMIPSRTASSSSPTCAPAPSPGHIVSTRTTGSAGAICSARRLKMCGNSSEGGPPALSMGAHGTRTIW
jgi:hypothetical protein